MGMLVSSSDLQGLYEKAAAAMMDIIFEKPPSGNGRKINVSLEGSDLTDLLIRWLGEILYLFQGERLIATGVKVDKLSSTMLQATVTVVAFDPFIHEIRHEIKAVTYHQSLVSSDVEGWQARVIFDL